MEKVKDSPQRIRAPSEIVESIIEFPCDPIG